MHVTDNAGKILLPKELSQGAFVAEWAKKTGEEQFSAQHLRKWLSKGLSEGSPEESAVSKIERQRNEAYLHFLGLKRDVFSGGSGRVSPFLELEKGIYDWVFLHMVDNFPPLGLDESGGGNYQTAIVGIKFHSNTRHLLLSFTRQLPVAI